MEDFKKFITTLFLVIFIVLLVFSPVLIGLKCDRDIENSIIENTKAKCHPFEYITHTDKYVFCESLEGPVGKKLK
jgi:hypothetical protein